jgi:hypothetical protein
MTKRNHPLIAISLMLLFACITSYADVVTLKAQVTALTTGFTNELRSQKLIIGTNQVAHVLHFYSFNTNYVYSGVGPTTDDLYALNVSYNELSVLYTCGTLFGAYSPSRAGISVLGSSPLTIVGPAVIEVIKNPALFSNLSTYSGTHISVCTVEVSGVANLVTQNNVVEVPPDNGPYQISLETATELQDNWQSATLGRYGASDQKRYFRLKIIRD